MDIIFSVFMGALIGIWFMLLMQVRTGNKARSYKDTTICWSCEEVLVRWDKLCSKCKSIDVL